MSPAWYEAPARRHAILRIAAGASLAFVVSELMGWYPTFLAPILVIMLLASLPAPLPLKAGAVLMLVQAAGAFSALALSSFLRERPIVLIGAIGLILFQSFSIIARGKGFFPLLLVLVCYSTIPIVTMTTPAQAGGLPIAFVRGMAVALVTTWLVHGVWPLVSIKAAAASGTQRVQPFYLALAGTAIVLPLMTIYLLYGLTDALPVLITTVVLVVNFDASRGALQGLAMILANCIGGLIAVAAHSILQIAPSLFTLAGITFAIGVAFARRIEKGGAGGTVAMITFNQAIIMLSLGLIPGPSNAGIWASRVLQFAIAYAFAVGMMYLLLPRATGSGPAKSQKERRRVSA